MNIIENLFIRSIIKDVRNIMFNTISNDPKRRNIIKNKLGCDSIDEFMKLSSKKKISD